MTQYCCNWIHWNLFWVYSKFQFFTKSKGQFLNFSRSFFYVFLKLLFKNECLKLREKNRKLKFFFNFNKNLSYTPLSPPWSHNHTGMVILVAIKCAWYFFLTENDYVLHLTSIRGYHVGECHYFCEKNDENKLTHTPLPTHTHTPHYCRHWPNLLMMHVWIRVNQLHGRNLKVKLHYVS